MVSRWLAFVLVVTAARAASVEKRAVAFEADASINVAGILNAAKSSNSAGTNVLASFRTREDVSNPNVKVQGDWLNLANVSAFHFIADMDTDCDGVYYNCPNNPSGWPETNWGHLDARVVPWIVIPQSFLDQQSSRLRGNALSAVICNGRMFYAIFGDTNGATPEVIGEASLMLAQTCFPNDGLDGGKGHDQVDVTYIVWGTQIPSGVGDQTINIPALKQLGDQQARVLQSALGLGGSTTTTSPPSTPTKVDKCRDDNDCSGSDVCCVFASLSNGCIAQSSCTNEQCFSGSVQGWCDGG
ncbi:Chitosanase-domain-containing protein [Exidia glandulosa HHB12029]|uniref:Endo-chitosanase n=1 Tax=Exidia glandulosa HHB12029 TaxID=1314781 RepID=A0A165CBG9_EXIGL|nr:Chitosanase-domain-containing protein [Exidia glandulosa HHB12029]